MLAKIPIQHGTQIRMSKHSDHKTFFQTPTAKSRHIAISTQQVLSFKAGFRPKRATCNKNKNAWIRILLCNTFFFFRMYENYNYVNIWHHLQRPTTNE